MLAFVHKLPCRDDDGVTTKDLSKVSTFFWPSRVRFLFFFLLQLFLNSFLSHLPYLATPFECSDGEFRDVPATAVPGRSGQFLSSSEEIKKNLKQYLR